MNHKPGSVPKSTLLGSAICLKEPFSALFCSLPALNRRVADALFDFAPDEVCLFPASPEKGEEVLPLAKLLPLPVRNRYLAGIVANAEVGFYPAFSPLPDHLTT